MKIRISSLSAVVVTSVVAYFISLLENFSLSQGILTVIAISVVAYLISEHLVPMLERWWSSRRKDGQPMFRIEGLWWEVQSAHAHIKIAAINIRYNCETQRISIDGTAYNDDGSEGAVFRSLASVLLPERCEIFYQWEGNLNSQPNNVMRGVGTFAFNAVKCGPFHEGMGDYIEFAMDRRPMCLVQLSLIRFTAEEERSWEAGDHNVRKQIVCERLTRLR